MDDHLLLRLLLDDEPAALRPAGAELFTTGLWYHRLCRALNDSSVVGALSRSLGRADIEVAHAAVRSVTTLPDAVGLLSLRDLSWPMARLLGDGVRLNLLGLEALAAAEALDGELCMAAADRNPPLTAAAKARGVRMRVVRG